MRLNSILNILSPEENIQFSIITLFSLKEKEKRFLNRKIREKKNILLSENKKWTEKIWKLVEKGLSVLIFEESVWSPFDNLFKKN